MKCNKCKRETMAVDPNGFCPTCYRQQKQYVEVREIKRRDPYGRKPQWVKDKRAQVRARKIKLNK